MSAAAIAQDRAGTGVQPGLHRTVVVAALGVGIYLAALDISIVNAILPVVADAFGTDLSAIQWVVTSYLLVQSALLLAVGRLADIWGHKRIYLLGLDRVHRELGHLRPGLLDAVPGGRPGDPGGRRVADLRQPDRHPDPTSFRPTSAAGPSASRRRSSTLASRQVRRWAAG